jgi:hypothetical protein
VPNFFGGGSEKLTVFFYQYFLIERLKGIQFSITVLLLQWSFNRVDNICAMSVFMPHFHHPFTKLKIKKSGFISFFCFYSLNCASCHVCDYCNVYGLCHLIIVGSGSDELIYWTHSGRNYN